ncbi:MAG TPA: oligosaccharide flippase family protein [Rubrobacter sp.]|nr:oligosaccharide flippase family protein [Rubrobacter sp.]
MTSEENPKRDETTPDNEPETNDRSDILPAGKSKGPPIAAGDAPSGVPGVAETDTLGEDKDDTYVARVARGAGISTAGQGIGRVLGYFSLLAIARLFGPTAQGFYQAGVAVLNGAQILARFGMENGVVRYVAHYRAQGDTARVKGTIIQAIAITFALSLVLATIMFFGAGFVEGWQFRDYSMKPVLRAFAVVLPFFVFMMMVLWATQGFQTVTYASYVQQMIRPALFVVFLGVFYLLGTETIGIIAAFGVSMFLGSLVAVYYLYKLFPEIFDRTVPAKFETKALFNVSVPMSITTGAQYLNTWSALLVLGIFAIGPPVAIFGTAARTATLSTIVRFAFSGIFSPMISSFYSRGEMGELDRLYKDISRWIFTGAFAIFLLIVVLADEVLAVFGQAYVAGVAALIIVAFAQLYSSAVGPTPRMLAMTENQNVVMVATAVAAVVGLAVSVILIWSASTSEGKILGAAIGMATGIVVENTATLLAVRRRLGFWPYNLAWLKPLVAGLAAAAAAYLIGVLVPLSVLPTLVVSGAVFGLIYLALLLVFGLSATDKEFLGAFWNVALRSLRRVRRIRGGAMDRTAR